MEKLSNPKIEISLAAKSSKTYLAARLSFSGCTINKLRLVV